MSRWVVFFSQTGSEILDLAAHFNRIPDTIVTTKSREQCEELDLYKCFLDRFVFLSKKSSDDEYINAIGDGVRENSIVTLHGFMRILPSSICDKYNIFNLHPGLINKYPELKGKDPQIRAFENTYDTVGAVIHRVISDVDSGEINDFVEFGHEGLDKRDFFNTFKNKSLQLWIGFLKKQHGF